MNVFFDEKQISKNHLIAIGCDGTNTNVGTKGDIIRLLELHLQKPLHWFVCQLHGNELPLRHLISFTGCQTSGPNAFSGGIGEYIKNCQNRPIKKFKKIPTAELPFIDAKELSTDQNYLFNICMAVISGVCPEQLSKKDPGRLVHSRWLTTANRILRYYVSVENPSEELLMLATYIVKVYAPMWFCIKLNSLAVDGAKNTHKLIKLTRYLPANIKSIVDPVIQRNAFFAHPECIILSMLLDSKIEVRKLAYKRIMTARKSNKSSRIREFKIPELRFENVGHYYDIIDWSSSNNKISEPPLTMELTSEELLEIVKNPEKYGSSVNFPCHTQAVERTVKLVTEASSAVCGFQKRDAWIKTTINSRKNMPTFLTKSEYSFNT